MLLLLVYVSIVIATCGGAFVAMLMTNVLYWTRIIFIASYMAFMIFSLYLVNKHVDDMIEHAQDSFIQYGPCGCSDISDDDESMGSTEILTCNAP